MSLLPTHLTRSYSLYCYSCLTTPFHQVGVFCYQGAKKIVEFVLSKIFYNGYRNLPLDLVQKRTQELIDKKGAIRVPCKNDQGKQIDMLYIPSKSPHKTGNVLVFTLNEMYQDFHPRNYEHYLEDGADIVLWNPTELNAKQYAHDLVSVLKSLRPQQKVTIQGYCAGVEPVIAAAKKMNNPNISLILDRGWGDTYKLARSFTPLVDLPIIREVIREKYDNQGMQHIGSISGNILFIAPQPREDQMMHYGKGRNFTYDLHHERLFCPDSFIEMSDSHHWSKKDADTINELKIFLRSQEVISRNFSLVDEEAFPKSPPPTFFERYVYPLIMKCPC